MKIGIITNYSKEKAADILSSAASLLKSKGAELYAIETEKTKLDLLSYLPEEQLFKTAEVFVVIGGDGIIIHNAKKASMYGKSVSGINAGRVGYLAGLEKEEIEKLELLIKGQYKVENRMLLSVTIGDKIFYCLNDAVISKGNISRMIDISARTENDLISYRADGLIAATPTGSTAYSLSAGGPIVDYQLESIMLTPICPQSLHSRPILLNKDETVKVSAVSSPGTEIYLTVDGEVSLLVDKKDEIVISKAKDYFVKLIKLNSNSFLTAISEKFS
jgi:NAD+ kinase